MSNTHDERDEGRHQVFQLYDESELANALGRLENTGGDGQDLWLLDRIYRLAIEIGTFCGQGLLPESPSIEDQEVAASRTLTAELRGDDAFDDARTALAKLDVRQPAEVLISESRKLVKKVADAYRESLQKARNLRRGMRDAELIRDGSGTILPFHEQMSLWDQQLAMIQETNRQLALMDHLAKRQADIGAAVQDAINDATAAEKLVEAKRVELAELRAQEASRDLSAHFQSLAKAERRKGAALRGTSVVALSVALCVALVPEAPWMPDVGGRDPLAWPVLTRHLAITLLLAGGAAYAARLASSHYNFGQWAKSIQIQLDSFEGFIGVVEEQSARDRMREEFGRRVLGAPPLTTDDGSPGLTTGELLQFVNSARGASSESSRS